jgi:hypothetical protein
MPLNAVKRSRIIFSSGSWERELSQAANQTDNNQVINEPIAVSRYNIQIIANIFTGAAYFLLQPPYARL